MILSQIPVRNISGMRKYPEPNTTALGGVATGNMNAQEAAIVTENMIMNG